MNSTEAWVISPSTIETRGEPAELTRRTVELPAPDEGQALIEPIFGCWEGNMTHAIRRQPVDVCVQRREPFVVLGNSGVVRVLKAPGSGLHEGQLCVFFGTGRKDAFGYMELAHGFDAPNTVGLLARRAVVPTYNLIPLPQNTYSLEQWAAFSLRYVTAWSNWRVAIAALRIQMPVETLPCPDVLGWSGGTTFAELTLARLEGCSATMISGSDAHLRTIREAGLGAIDRRDFPYLAADPGKSEDRSHRINCSKSERTFLSKVEEATGGRGASIFVDYIGGPVQRPTLRALARQGVLTTAGWLRGLETAYSRPKACISRQIFVHTHYARRDEAEEAIRFAIEKDWMPQTPPAIPWEDIPALASLHDAGQCESMFPIYQVNPL